MLAGITFTALIIGMSEPTIKNTFDPELKEITDLRPDAFMEGIYQRQFDQNGQVKTTLAATSLLDFGTRSNAESIDPRLWLSRPEGTWFIEADSGVLTADRNQLHLKKNVIVNRLDYGRAPWKLTGDSIHWDQSTDLITSDGSTILSQGSAKSIGNELVLDLNTSEYSLGDKVRMQWQSITSSD